MSSTAQFQRKDVVNYLNLTQERGLGDRNGNRYTQKALFLGITSAWAGGARLFSQIKRKTDRSLVMALTQKLAARAA
jgi:hypothetical protein